MDSKLSTQSSKLTPLKEKINDIDIQLTLQKEALLENLDVPSLIDKAATDNKKQITNNSINALESHPTSKVCIPIDSITIELLPLTHNITTHYITSEEASSD